MMTDFEKAEKLREKTGVSYAEAKEALDSSGGSMLDALIYLENQGKTNAPTGGGYYSGAGTPSTELMTTYNDEKRYNGSGEDFSDLINRFGRFCKKVINKGMTNFLDAYKGEEVILSCPVLAVVALVVFFFWVTIPLFVISLFLGVRYRFRGPDLGLDSINKVMDDTSNTVDDVKRSFTESTSK